MLRFFVRRILLVVPALFGLLTMTFILIRVVPADPAGEIAGEAATPEQLEEIREEYGFNRPLYEQYFVYLWKVGHGDLGKSFYSGRPIIQDLAERLPATLEIVVLVILFGATGGIALGVVAGVYHNSAIDHFVRSISVAGLALAHFWLAIMLQILFAMDLDILPLRGRISPDLGAPPHFSGFYLVDSVLAGRPDMFWDAAKHLVLPVFVQATGPLATIARFTRSGMLETLQKDFVVYEHAVAYPPRRIIWIYVLRNSVVAPVTQIGLLFGNLLGGAVVIEAIFDFPGIGLYMVQSILEADYNGVLAVTLLAGVIFAIVNIIVDLVHALIDPRVAEQL